MIHSALGCLPLTDLSTELKRSANNAVPVNTRAVASQCVGVKGLWKYMMEKMRLANFLSVTTNVTTKEGHSVVKVNTPRIQTYCVIQFPRMYSHILGTGSIPNTRIGSRVNEIYNFCSITVQIAHKDTLLKSKHAILPLLPSVEPKSLA